MVNGKSNTRNEKGFSVVEIIFAVALLGIFFGIVIPLLTGGRDSTSVSLEVTQMRSTLDNISNRYFAEPIDASLDNQQVISGRLASRSYRTSGGNIIYNQFGGTVEINGVAENGLTWATNDIPSNVCLDFVQQGRGLGFLSVNIGGSGELQYSQTNVAEMTQNCESAAGTNDTVDIVFTRPNS